MSYHFLKRDDMDDFLDHVPDNPDGTRGYLVTVIPVYKTDEISFAIKDLGEELKKQSPLEPSVSAC